MDILESHLVVMFCALINDGQKNMHVVVLFFTSQGIYCMARCVWNVLNTQAWFVSMCTLLQTLSTVCMCTCVHACTHTLQTFLCFRAYDWWHDRFPEFPKHFFTYYERDPHRRRRHRVCLCLFCVRVWQQLVTDSKKREWRLGESKTHPVGGGGHD